MFRTITRLFLPNPLDWKVKRCAKRGGKKILLGWNRGLGDIALGLYAIVHRIREWIPDAEITFLIRENLQEGFSMLDGVKTLVAPDWKRGAKGNVKRALHLLKVDPRSFDLILENPSPTDWVAWQRGNLVPRLKWNLVHESLWKKFNLPEEMIYIGVQVVAETNYGLWRNWPLAKWEELFARLEKWENVRILLFGFGDTPVFSHPHVIDLRGKTTLFELLSLVKHKCRFLILPDSGILSMVYYLDVSFPIQVISLWADPTHGILKQAVPSPNPQLCHHPVIAFFRDLSTLPVETVLDLIFPKKPMRTCLVVEQVGAGNLEGVGAILLAGGQGSRLGVSCPKGVFPVLGKSLFQWICEKVPEDFPLAIMTSPLNHKETVEFFQTHQFFGRRIFFFSQPLLPLLDEEKNPLPIQGPDGNGSVFQAFIASGLGEQFEKLGVDLLTIIPVENPLADPADLKLIGYARETGADVVLKCVERKSPQESMGVLVEREGRIEVTEYIDLDPSQEYPYAYTGMMAIRFSFFRQMGKISLPVHWVQKQHPGYPHKVWKREKFIFDILPYAKKVLTLSYPRSQCYAPIKSAQDVRNLLS